MPKATLPDGATLAYDDYDFTTPWDPGEPVVLVHGFSKNRRMWYGWIPGLSAQYRVIRVDQRGHGDSSPPPADFQMALRPFSQMASVNVVEKVWHSEAVIQSGSQGECSVFIFASGQLGHAFDLHIAVLHRPLVILFKQNGADKADD